MNAINRLQTKLGEQIGFLERSCKQFDDGHEEEAFRLSTTIRVLFHETKKSTSLLKHCNLRRGRMLSSSRGLDGWKNYLGHQITLNQNPPVKMKALLKDHFQAIYLLDWWEKESIFTHDGKSYTRKDIVLSMANKDGGAHVDEKLQAYYEILMSGEWAFGITPNLEFSGEAPYKQGVKYFPNNAHLALMRQFAHEVLASSKHFGWLSHSS